jgi:hypothetical protein
MRFLERVLKLQALDLHPLPLGEGRVRVPSVPAIYPHSNPLLATASLRPEGEGEFQNSLLNGPPPSRRDNPFATCWTKPGALPFRFQDGQSAEQLVARLAGQNWWGQIIGPHGSGKSTLLATLLPAITATGRRVHELRLHKPTGRLESDAKEMERDRTLVVVDGFEQLGRFARLRLRHQCRRAGAGLLVTTHVSSGLPTLIRLSPERRLVEQLVGDLCLQVSSRITRDDVAASHASHGSNVREIFFDLYDRHERMRRKTRTAAGDTSYQLSPDSTEINEPCCDAATRAPLRVASLHPLPGGTPP